ncbi:MAG: acyl-CoA dehydrogenase family protein [Acidimicrobiia bacterium]
MQRHLFADEHQQFRSSFRRFLETEIQPHYEEWESEGIIPRAAIAAAAELGLLGMAYPEEFGGGGTEDFRFSVVVAEEIARLGITSYGLTLGLITDICGPYFLRMCTQEQRERWYPGLIDGSLIPAVAMTEPAIGSDLASMSTRARRDGDRYFIDGAKTFISNGINADLIITAVKTDPTQRHTGMSLIVVEAGTPGFERGRNLDKIGMHAQDTAELFFTEAEVPVSNLLGEEGAGFLGLVSNLPQERLSIAVGGLALARAAFDWTLAYAKEREAFGKPIGTFQHSRFVFAEILTELNVTEAYVDACVTSHLSGELTAEEAASAKYWCTELQGRVVDRCVQMFGGYGYMREYPIARAFVDARISRIYGGTNEIMREIVGRSLGI